MTHIMQVAKIINQVMQHEKIIQVSSCERLLTRLEFPTVSFHMC